MIVIWVVHIVYICLGQFVKINSTRAVIILCIIGLALLLGKMEKVVPIRYCYSIGFMLLSISYYDDMSIGIWMLVFAAVVSCMYFDKQFIKVVFVLANISEITRQMISIEKNR